MITDVHGNAIAWSSAGALGSQRLRKSTPFAAQMASEVAKPAQEHGLKSVEVTVKVQVLVVSQLSVRLLPLVLK